MDNINGLILCLVSLFILIGGSLVVGLSEHDAWGVVFMVVGALGMGKSFYSLYKNTGTIDINQFD